MANLYGYNPTYGGPGAPSLSTAFASRPTNDSYLPESILASRYIADRYSADLSSFSHSQGVSQFLLNQKDAQRYPISDSGALGMSAASLYSSARLSGVGDTVPSALHLSSQGSWLSADVGASATPAVANLRRHNEAFYHQTLLGANNALGQTEAWLATNSQSKRPRFETAGNLPIYPQRPGEKDCAYYMLTRTCKFGDSCKFDHPIWVPEGGIPDWKEVPIDDSNAVLPERPGEPDCPYFMKTQRCKFGSNCKFNHPKVPMDSSGTLENVSGTLLPERPSEPACPFYLKTGRCKFGMACKFHHPKDVEISANSENFNTPMLDGTADGVSVKLNEPSGPAVMFNSKGLPIRQGEQDCPFYMKTGSCKFGPTCRFNHPAITTPAPAVINHAATNLSFGFMNPAGLLVPPGTHQFDPVNMGYGAAAMYPQRPGQIECDFYMKTGVCKFGERCRFHHPVDRSAPAAASVLKQALEQQSVKLTLAGLPRREGVTICPFYMKTGTCKFGATCKFDHPPPAEVMALASADEAREIEEEKE